MWAVTQGGEITSSSFRNDGYRDAIAGKTPNPPSIPAFAVEYQDGFIVGNMERNRAGDLFHDYPLDPPGYAARVRQLEDEGLTTSDAQAAANVEYGTP